MNKFKTDIDGGLPYMLDDIRFIQDTYTQGFVDLLKSVAKDTNCLLWGCETSSGGTGVINISEGAVWLNNEVYHVPAQSINSTTYLAIYPEIFDDSLRIFGDGTSHKIWEIRRGKVEEDSGPGGVQLYNPLTLLGVIQEHADNADNAINAEHSNNANFLVTSNWISPTLSSGWSGDIKYRRVGNFIEIKGHLAGDGSGGVTPFNLNSGYRPDMTITFLLFDYVSSNGYRLSLFDNGNFQMQTSTCSVYIDIFFTNS